MANVELLKKYEEFARIMLKELYNEIAERNNRQVNREELSGLLNSPRPGELLRSIFMKQHFKGRMQEELEVRNIIIFRVMLRYLKKIIQRDLAIAPFELVSAELDYRRSLEIRVGEKTVEPPSPWALK